MPGVVIRAGGAVPVNAVGVGVVSGWSGWAGWPLHGAELNAETLTRLG